VRAADVGVGSRLQRNDSQSPGCHP
jgi:hypothetical protein